MKSVCVYVCMYVGVYVCVYVCMYVRLCVSPCFEVSSWNLGVGDGPTRFVGIFSKRPHLGLKVIQRSICLRNALWLPNFVGRIPDQRVMHYWGQRSCRGHPGSTRGQIASKCPMATKFGRKNPWPECNALMGSKILQGSAGVSQR